MEQLIVFFSLEPKEFKLLVRECKNAFYSLGKIDVNPSSSEKNILNTEDLFM